MGSWRGARRRRLHGRHRDRGAGRRPAGTRARASPPRRARPHAGAAPPLRVVSISPASGERDVNGAGNITVTYNQPLPATAPLPTLSPAIAGAWQRTGDAVVFSAGDGIPGGHARHGHGGGCRR